MSNKDFEYMDIPSVEQMFLGGLNQKRIQRLLWTSESREILRIGLNKPLFTERQAIMDLWEYFHDADIPDSPPPTCDCEPPRDLRWHKVDNGEAVTVFYDSRGQQWSYINAINVAIGSIEAVGDIKFAHVASPRAADIVITNELLDGRGGTLGQAYQPATGDRMAACGPMCGNIAIDTAERWHLSYFAQIILHELLHAIGVKHSRSRKSVMYPQYQGTLPLSDEDISEIRKRYPYQAPIV